MTEKDREYFIKQALITLNKPQYHIITKQQAELQTHNIWFNLNGIEKVFPNRQEFAKIVSSRFKE